MELELSRETTDAGARLVLSGSVDLVTRQALLEAGTRELSDGHALELDMQDVDFIDSTGIGALVELKHLARTHGTSVCISRSSARVERVLEITGMAEDWFCNQPS